CLQLTLCSTLFPYSTLFRTFPLYTRYTTGELAENWKFCTIPEAGFIAALAGKSITGATADKSVPAGTKTVIVPASLSTTPLTLATLNASTWTSAFKASESTASCLQALKSPPSNKTSPILMIIFKVFIRFYFSNPLFNIQDSVGTDTYLT